MPPPKTEAVAENGVNKSFGEGEARTTAVNNVAFVAHFGVVLENLETFGALAGVEDRALRHLQGMRTTAP